MSMPIYLMFIRVLLSVEFCFTLKTYLKGAPFYNASHSRKSELHHASAGHESETSLRAGIGCLEAGVETEQSEAATHTSERVN